MATCIVTEIKDHFNTNKNWPAALGVAICGVLFGSVYYTQSGFDILDLVDHYGATFVAFNLVFFELLTFCHIYGVDRLCLDIKFMLKFRPGPYWRICWRFLTPALTFGLVSYYYYDLYHGEKKDFGSKFPDGARYAGYLLAASALCQFPIIMIYEIYRSEGDTLVEKIREAFKPLSKWGPRDEKLQLTYQQFLCEEGT